MAEVEGAGTSAIPKWQRMVLAVIGVAVFYTVAWAILSAAGASGGLLLTLSLVAGFCGSMVANSIVDRRDRSTTTES
jgi:hypothetical protein